MKTNMVSTLVTMIMAALFTVGFAEFADAGNLKERFLERSPAIRDLMEKSIVGENNKGFLEFIGGKQINQAVVNAENSDRLKLYTAIAQKRGTRPEEVGAQRAIQIANRAKSGVMLQDAGGKWYKK